MAAWGIGIRQLCAFVEAEELKNSSVLSNGNDVMPYTKTLYENSAIGKVESDMVRVWNGIIGEKGLIADI